VSGQELNLIDINPIKALLRHAKHEHRITMLKKSKNPEQFYNIAIVFPEWYPFLTSVVEGIFEIRGLREHCRFRNFVFNDIADLSEFPKGYRPDGVLIAYADYSDECPLLNELGVPIVNVYPSVKNVHPSVGICFKSLAKTVVDHLTSLGFEEIGVLGTKGQTDKSLMWSCLEEECLKRDVPHWYLGVPDGILPGFWSQLEVHAPELKEKLLHPSRRTGIYAIHDVRGRLLADYCMELGVKIPENIGILARFDSINARLCTPELSSVVVPSKKIGKQAIKLLIDLIDGNPIKERNPLIEVKVVKVRESTVGKFDPDMIALKAQTLIQKNACRGLTVGELIESLPLARSSFEKRYKELTGVSPAQEIRQIRIERAQVLLRESSKTIKEIAEEVGFQDPRPFVVFFKREVGKTPGAFREGS